MTPLHVAETNPYPWPFDGRVVAAQFALLICGAQRDLVDASSGSEDVAGRLGDVAEVLRKLGGQVIWVRHGTRDAPPRATASLPIRGTPGWQLVFDVEPADVVVDSAGWDGCYGSDLDQVLRSRGLRSVVLGGFGSEITVDSTVRTLNDQGHECLVLVDGCAPLDQHLGSRAHASLTMSGGIFGALGSTESLIIALWRSSHS